MDDKLRHQLWEIHRRARPSKVKLKSDDDLVFCVMGMLGEAGEVANVVKKIMRGDEDQELYKELRSELADVRIYHHLILEILDLDEDVIIAEKIKELQERRPDWFKVDLYLVSFWEDNLLSQRLFNSHDEAEKFCNQNYIPVKQIVRLESPT